jgi:hypothetical protein
MKIKFLMNYVGRETAMKQYYKGDVEELPDAQALEIIRLGGAEEVVFAYGYVSTLSELPAEKPKKKKVQNVQNS